MQYHRENPGVWRAFEQFALRAVAAGREKIGAKAIIERIRWEIEVEQRGEFKLDNSFVSYMARVFVRKYPQHAHLFEFRKINGLSSERYAA